MTSFRIRDVRRFAIAAGFAGLCAARLAGADGFRSPAPSSRLEPGSMVRVAWDAPQDERPGGEIELVLSLDGGTTFPVRVTRSLPLRTSEWTWRVPSFPTTHARLALRSGEEEGAGSEEIVFVSGEFEIVALAGAPLERIFSVEGEWRTAEALDERPQPAIPATLCPDDAVEPASDGPDVPTPVPAPRSRPIAPANPTSHESSFPETRESPAITSDGLGSPRLLPLRL